MERLTRILYLFDHFAQLVDLDWENAAIATCVVFVFYRFAEKSV